MKTQNYYKHGKSKPLELKSVKILDSFWSKYQELILNESIPFQLQMLEEVGTVDNFRIVAKTKEGFRKGFFHSDSDLFKWLEAASFALNVKDDKKLKEILKEIIDSISKAQDSDGYLFTANQFHFPNRKWTNFQIEHELYSSGHLIEAGIAHKIVTGQDDLFKVAKFNADLIEKLFRKCHPTQTPGHQEIELALIKLYRLTSDKKYLKLGQRFIEQRGKVSKFYKIIFRNALEQIKWGSKVKKQKNEYFKEKMIKEEFSPFEDEFFSFNPFILFRSLISFLSGKYFQQHLPIREQTEAVGHSVRFAYFMAGVADLFLEIGDKSLLRVLERLWKNMTLKRMYITGGLGSLPLIEGFGKDYELPNKSSYCETCAAIGSIIWNMKMSLITDKEKYADLLEKQLYNAMLVGISLNGRKFTYSNPLESKIGIERKKWFLTPCCPSNVARIILSLTEYVYSKNHDAIWIHQFISSEVSFDMKDANVTIIQKSKFPWNGNVDLKINSTKPINFKIKFRIPEFASEVKLQVNQDKPVIIKKTGNYQEIERTWANNDNIRLEFPMKIKLKRDNEKVKENRNQVVVTRGPLIYCLEKIDNPNLNLSKVKISNDSEFIEKEDMISSMKIISLIIKLPNGENLKAIPYFCISNRKLSPMRLWIKLN